MSDIRDQVAILGGTGNHDLDKLIIDKTSDLLGLSDRFTFLHLNGGLFSDGETDMRIESGESLRDKHVVILQSAHSSEFKEEFLTLAWSARNEHGAKSVIGVLSFMRYRRQDSDNPDEISRAKEFVHDMACDRFDHVIFCDIHSEKILKYCKEYNLGFANADPSPLYADKIRPHMLMAKEKDVPFYAYSPDIGSISRAASLARELGCEVCFNSKFRKHEGDTELVGTDNIDEIKSKYPDVNIIEADKNLKGSIVCMREDEVSTGGTASSTGWYLLNELGVEAVLFCGTHPVCTAGWKRKFVDKSPFKSIYFGNTIERGYINSTGGRVTTVDVSSVIAIKLVEILSDLTN